jgi:hypothetical protein
VAHAQYRHVVAQDLVADDVRIHYGELSKIVADWAAPMRKIDQAVAGVEQCINQGTRRSGIIIGYIIIDVDDILQGRR